MTGREEILGRIRRAVGPAASEPAGEPARGGADGLAVSAERRALPRGYRRDLAGGGGDVGGDTTGGDLVGLFLSRVADYRAVVHRVAPDEVPRVVAGVLAARGARRVVVPDGFPDAWLPEDGDLTVLRDAGPLPVGELDRADGVLTTAAVGIAETGTIVLDAGGGQGRRALTLVPDYHLCVVLAGQVVGGVPEALARLDPRRPLTFVSGPSATSDIELDRVEGVHGPRTLEVLVVG